MDANQLNRAMSHTGGSSPRVLVYCDSPAHEGQRFNVAQFLYNRNLGYWSLEPFFVDGKRAKAAADNWAGIVDGKPFDAKKLASSADNALVGKVIGQHFSVVCPKCGAGKGRGRQPGEKLWPILDALAAAGFGLERKEPNYGATEGLAVCSISLSLFSARLP